MSEMHAPDSGLRALAEMRAEVERLNAASPGARYFLGAPENALADFTVRDRLLLDDDVVSRHFGLEAAGAEVLRRNAEAAAIGPEVARRGPGRPPVPLGLLAVLLVAAALVVSEAGWANPPVAAAMNAIDWAPEPWQTVGHAAIIALLGLLAVGPLFMGFALIVMRRRLK